MFEKLQKKMGNVFLLLDLTKMTKKIPRNFSRVMDTQSRRLQKLMKKAYKIPFYRERFDAAGVKPEDIKTADDLVKLPVLTKDELREWMAKEIQNPKYKNWIVDTTSGSTGKPLSILFSPREKTYMRANWFRVMMVAGYNPFFGKTMSRINAHDENAGGPIPFCSASVS